MRIPATFLPIVQALDDADDRTATLFTYRPRICPGPRTASPSPFSSSPRGKPLIATLSLGLPFLGLPALFSDMIGTRDP